jgi:hypothetical protein
LGEGSAAVRREIVGIEELGEMGGFIAGDRQPPKNIIAPILTPFSTRFRQHVDSFPL